jgi:hypothetical protein
LMSRQCQHPPPCFSLLLVIRQSNRQQLGKNLTFSNNLFRGYCFPCLEFCNKLFDGMSLHKIDNHKKFLIVS